MRRALVTVLLLIPVEAVLAQAQLKIVFTSFMHVDQVQEWSEVYMMDPDGSNITRLTHTDGEERWPTPGPDGTLLYWSDDLRRQSHSNPGDVFKLDLRTRQVTQLTPGTGSWNGARLSPTGDKLVVSTAWDSHFPGRLIVWDLNSGDWTPLLSDSTSALWGGWSPEGTTLEYTSPTAWPSWSPDGTRVVYSSLVHPRVKPDNWEIDIVDVMTGDIVRLTEHDSADIMPSWSPDGDRIVFVSTRNATASSPVGRRGLPVQGDIFTMAVDGSDLRQLTDNATDEISPTWSPDGRQIAYSGRVDGRWEIHVMNEDGSGRTQLTSNSGSYYPTWFWLTNIDSAVHMTSWGELKQGNAR